MKIFSMNQLSMKIFAMNLLSMKNFAMKRHFYEIFYEKFSMKVASPYFIY